ncbi:glycoside hydrolase family 25 protein [Mesorhizobium terrae]
MLLKGRTRQFHRILTLAAGLVAGTGAGAASDFSEPWKKDDRALVIDAYEYNPIDWPALASDKRIVGFINKASDGLPPPYACGGTDTEQRLCKALWKRHAVARELFQTRKVVARALGLQWGAYHLARPGNPVEQADSFVDFADPSPDDLLAIDIEDNDPQKWMSLDDAEEFVRQVHRRVGRFPILYTNEVTASHIAANRYRYQLLSRLPLWYARYKPEVGASFPKGHWNGYALWQFAAQANCGRVACPYRPAGTPMDIDVNVAPMDAGELRRQWPFGGLIDVPADYLASVPVPLSREAGLRGERLTYAAVAAPPTLDELVAVLKARWTSFRDGFRKPPLVAANRLSNPLRGIAGYVAEMRQRIHPALVSEAAPPVGIDPVTTGSIGPKPAPALPFAGR